MPMIGITRGLSTWKFQDHYVERVMDNAAYTAAHPDDTLVLAGPPRSPSYGSQSSSVENQMLAIGHLQTVQFSQQKPTQPVMAIGSGRTFFVSGKAQGSATLARLFVNGRNLLRVLQHTARANNVPVEKFDDRAANRKEAQYYINLDSELYLIPVGLGSLFRDKIHNAIGGFYAELCMITSYAIGFNAGQNMIMEQTSIVFDRLLPFFEDLPIEGGFTAGSEGRATLDAVMGFVDQTMDEAASNDATLLQAGLTSALPPAHATN
jgi:hypothetical protein